MKKAIISTAILMLVCCGEADATSKKTDVIENPNHLVTTDENYKFLNRTVEINLDDMTFEEAFRVQYRAKGEGRTFWWRGEQYTTNLAVIDEFVLDHVKLNVNQVGWVTNNDDPDDACRSNKLDDCGVCDGPGKITWFRDADGDGLGTFMEWITSCTYPTSTEIEKFQAESLLEGGGDQGH